MSMSEHHIKQNKISIYIVAKNQNILMNNIIEKKAFNSGQDAEERIANVMKSRSIKLTRG